MAKRTRRRANGEGSIYRRKDGRWAAEWTARTLNGPKRRTVYGKTQAEVVRKRKEAMAQERGGMAPLRRRDHRRRVPRPVAEGLR